MTPPLRPSQTKSNEAMALRAEGLTKHFPIRKGVIRHQVGAVRAVDGIDLAVRRGETLSLVGESGCGKSTTGRLLARLLEPTAGRIWLGDEELTGLSPAQLRAHRRDVQIMFQDPYSSLSPRMTVGEIIAEPMRVQKVYGKNGRRRVVELMELVGLRAAQINRYAHEFSGGQRQRIGLARALALNPQLLILDEPVSALDVSIQAQVVNQLQDLQARLGLTYVFISHNLAVVRHLSDEVVVMYLGVVMERGSQNEIYHAPQHPYTQALLSAVPTLESVEGARRERITLAGDIPSASNPPSGCRFRTRCWKAREICATKGPPLIDRTGTGHVTACHFPDNVPEHEVSDSDV